MANPRTITVILTGPGGELDRESFQVAANHHDPDESININASTIIEGWTLSVGDTITIVEG